ncbi:MAG: 2-C-methyl-D-erythritol 4-phosphate cytidylyltransferase [Bifidobacteriaceae bacterium]|nr:2-C-methyl-D-erythritol 4-phosphate cytidylyltransferase [Bifidobacteriaceae bacterium]MCI1978727.1 2-C-methyl-D-erythritol 4-phosphate cytidylyltransferase [Bifidobacteriaceae bacterium]
MSLTSSVPVVAVILAAGTSSRFASDTPKQVTKLAKREVVDWAVRAFNRNESVTDIVVVTNPQVRDTITNIIDRENYEKVRMILDGGIRRSDSVEAALSALASAGIPREAKILVHDASRPFVSQQAITDVAAVLDDFTAAVVAAPAREAVVVTEDSEGRSVVASVPTAQETKEVQSPQGFRFATLMKAHEDAVVAAQSQSQSQLQGEADEMSLVRAHLPQERIAVVAGSEHNLAIVTVDDMPLAEAIAKEEALATVRQMISSTNFDAK